MGNSNSLTRLHRHSSKSVLEQLEFNSIDEKLNYDAVVAKNTVNCLILGTGDSGKSTITKQLHYIHQGLSSSESEFIIKTIRQNCVETITEVINFIESSDEEQFQNCFDSVQEAKDFISPFFKNMDNCPFDDEKFGVYLDSIWRLSTVQNLLHRRNEFNFHDSALFFMEKCIDIFRADYEVIAEDTIRARIVTTGVQEHLFKMPNNKLLKVIDVGGQKSERKKWMKHFTDIKFLIFVVAISDFDKSLYEDSSINRIQDSLEVWKDIVSKPEFENAKVILFLNKLDLLEEALKRSKIKDYISDYPYGDKQDQRTAMKYFHTIFAGQLVGKRYEELVIHFTAATDISLMTNVLKATEKVIMDASNLL